MRPGGRRRPLIIDDRGEYTYAELAERVSRFANAMRRLGIHREQRILLCLHDGIDFPTAFLGAIKAGVVPVAINTQLSSNEFAFMLADSRARAVVVSASILPTMKAALEPMPEPKPEIIVSDAEASERSLEGLLKRGARQQPRVRLLIRTSHAFGSIPQAQPAGPKERYICIRA